MNVIDSSAWHSYFAGDKNSSVFSRPIENLYKLLVPSITIAEVFKTVFRQRDQETALTVVAHMQQGQVVPLDAELAINAASHGLSYKLPLAGSIIFATARKYAATTWTRDTVFKGLPKVRFYPKAKHAQVRSDSLAPRPYLQMTGSLGASEVPEAGVSVRETGAP